MHAHKLRTASTMMAWLSLAFAALLVVAVPLAYLVPNPMFGAGPGLFLGFKAEDVSAAVPFFSRFAAMIVAAIPMGLAVWGLVSLFRLFRFYAEGKVFEAAPLRCLNRVTGLLFWFVLTSIVSDSATGYILHAAVGKPQLNISISSSNLAMLFLAGVALVVARVMGEAKRLADENATFI